MTHAKTQKKLLTNLASKLTPLTYHLIHPAVMRFVRYLFSKELERETEAELIGMGETGKQTVIVPFTTAKAVALTVESHAGNDGQRDTFIVDKEFTRGFQNTKTAKSEAMRTCIAMQFKVVAHDGGQNDFLPTAPAVDEGMGADLVGQGMIEQDCTGLNKHRVLLQPLEQGQRKGFQLLTGAGSLYCPDGLAKEALRP